MRLATETAGSGKEGKERGREREKSGNELQTQNVIREEMVQHVAEQIKSLIALFGFIVHRKGEK